MSNARQKGLAYVREVKHILEKRGWLVDGPFFKSVFIPGKPGRPGRQMVAHVDVFGVGDLLAVDKEWVDWLVQVTTDDSYASHMVAIEKANKALRVLLFSRCRRGRDVVYRVYDRQRQRVCGYTLAGDKLTVEDAWERATKGGA